MKKYLRLLAVLTLITAGCKKYESAPQTNYPPIIDDARSILLKDVMAQSLPSPYFHFVYDDQNYVKQISFASGLSVYNVEYENKRVKKTTNVSNGNYLLYSYDNDRVSEINEFSGHTGEKDYSYRLAYNSSNQLAEVLWFSFATNNNGDLYKKSVLTYQADGNLAKFEQYSSSTGTLLLVKTDRFSNYDDKTNVDDFYLLEDFIDSHLFLPQIKFQKNNPLKEQIQLINDDYDITYTYEYQNNLPVRKTGAVLQTRGTNAGNSLQITTQFSYY